MEVIAVYCETHKTYEYCVVTCRALPRVRIPADGVLKPFCQSICKHIQSHATHRHPLIAILESSSYPPPPPFSSASIGTTTLYKFSIHSYFYSFTVLFPMMITFKSRFTSPSHSTWVLHLSKCYGFPFRNCLMYYIFSFY